MSKEAFNRSKPHINIGEIGNKPATRADMELAAVKFIVENGQKRNQEGLLELISKYGLEEGVRKLDQILWQSEGFYDAIEKIDADMESSKTRQK